MAAATSIITEASPYIVRTSFTAAQATVPLAEWARKNNIKRVVTLVSDYGPGIDVEKAFSETFTKAGGQVENLRVPLANPDFSPFLQKVADAKPDALLAFVPSGVGAQFMKQFVERGLDKSGIRLLAEGSVTDDDLLNNLGDVALGSDHAHHYSAAHDSPENKAFVEAFKKANNGMRPNFMAMGGYDGLHLIYEGLKKTNGQGGEALVNAMKGHELDEPARPCLDRPADPRHRAEHLRPQGRARGRRALQCGVRDGSERQGSGQGRQGELTIARSAAARRRSCTAAVISRRIEAFSPFMTSGRLRVMVAMPPSWLSGIVW